MSPEIKLLLARLFAGLLLIVLATGFLIAYEQLSSGIFDDTAHRLSISYNSFSSALAGR
jgi:hypothetical protein